MQLNCYERKAISSYISEETVCDLACLSEKPNEILKVGASMYISSWLDWNAMTIDKPQPFLKWAGGKRALLPKILPHIDIWREKNPSGRFFEPFLGAGAVFLNIDSELKKIGNDYNQELIEVYQVVKSNPLSLIHELQKHKNEKEYFYSVRNWDRLPSWNERSPIERAARFIFLNKTCFNGLHRVNGKGQFNVPFGNYSNPTIYSADNLFSVSDFLNRSPKVKLMSGDYLKCTRTVRSRDFVYFDPPYDPISETSSFTSYISAGFGWRDQVALRDEAVRLVELGANVLLSNADTPRIRKIYRESGHFKIQKVEIHRGISAKKEVRGLITEVLISSIQHQ